MPDFKFSDFAQTTLSAAMNKADGTPSRCKSWRALSTIFSREDPGRTLRRVARTI